MLTDLGLGATDVPSAPDPPSPESLLKLGLDGAGAPQLGRRRLTGKRQSDLLGAPDRLPCRRIPTRLARLRRVAPGLLCVLGPLRERSRDVNENDHPKGALLFMLVYLALLAFLWTNLYLKLWTR